MVTPHQSSLLGVGKLFLFFVSLLSSSRMRDNAQNCDLVEKSVLKVSKGWYGKTTILAFKVIEFQQLSFCRLEKALIVNQLEELSAKFFKFKIMYSLKNLKR